MSNLDAALQLAGKGKRVLPLGDGGSKSAKIPRTSHGLHDATTDEQQIRDWWNAWPNANIGIRTGEVSGIVVLDVDDEAAFEEFERLHRTLPETLTVKTGRGGRHLIFEAPNHGTRIANRAGFAGLPGLDIRGDGGYIVAPPSIHENGTAYTFANRVKPVPPPAWFVELAQKKEPPRPPAPAKPAPTGGTPYGRKALEAEAADVARTPQGARNDALNRAAFNVGQLVAGGEIEHHDALEGLVVAGLTVGLPEHEARATVENGLTAGSESPRTAPEKPAPAKALREDGTVDREAEKVRRTDMGNARRLAKRYGDRLRYTSTHGWLAWDGKRWKLDELGLVNRAAKSTAKAIFLEAKNAKESDDAKALSKWALQSQSAARLASMVGLAQSEPEIATRIADFDLDPLLLNIENGTIDLRTGEPRPHRQGDRITKLAPVEFDPSARCPKWLGFLEEIMGGDLDLVDFLRRSVGYGLTGDVSEQRWWFGYGLGANGKSTFLRILLDLLGDYGRQTAPELLVARRGESHPTEVADLAGVRLSVCTEVGPDRSFDVVRIKQLTGGDRITARKMRMDFFEFDPTAKLWLAANHKPTVKDTSNSTWRRLLLVPFAVSIPEDRQDRHLLEKLREELPGILNWALDGCREWQRNGLRPPPKVLNATEAYRQDEDLLGPFLAECTTFANDAIVQATDLFRAYTSWAEENGENPVTQTTFGKRMTERGLESKPHGKRRRKHYFGLQISTDFSADFGQGETVGDSGQIADNSLQGDELWR